MMGFIGTLLVLIGFALLIAFSMLGQLLRRVEKLEKRGQDFDAEMMTDEEVAEVIRQQLHIAATRTFGSHAEWRNL